jgi:hypothetical protein
MRTLFKCPRSYKRSKWEVYQALEHLLLPNSTFPIIQRSGSLCHHGTMRPQVPDMNDRCEYIYVYTKSSSRGQTRNGFPPSGLGKRGLTIPQYNKNVTKYSSTPRSSCGLFWAWYETFGSYRKVEFLD